ncbi:hypothetical protein C2U48_25705 [Escherichia coli]|nr:hypothetical protein C2U48_25705 [Escherichia coli]EAB7359489.1 hypothetical protein [Escherichia coli]EAC0855559.1 hypothetical protein [Escherichia coli]EEW8391062.1 hypothetical protein [Escherichia coli]EEW9198579.1 hypothetical protein [Escherichia coli]
MCAYNNSNGHLLPPLLSLKPQRARCIFESSSTIESIQIRATTKNPCVSRFILDIEKIILCDEDP